MLSDLQGNNQKKRLQIKKANFLFDVIVPTIYDVDNIKLVQNYMKKITPTNKLQQLKKAKMNSKIEEIVRKNVNAENQNQFQHKPLLKKYQKQKVKLISEFSKSEVFKQQFNDDITSCINFKQRNKMTKSDLIKDDSDLQDQMRNSSLYQESNRQNKFLLDINDGKPNQKERGRQQNYNSFKQKMKKVVQKSKKLKVNKSENQLNKKIDFYLTQISPQKSYKKIKIILNDKHIFKDHVDYSKELNFFGKNGTQSQTQLNKIRQMYTNTNTNQNGEYYNQNNIFVRSRSVANNMQKQNTSKNLDKTESSLNQFRSANKLRPKTAGNSTRANSSLLKSRKSVSVFTSTYSSKKMRLNHYQPSSSQQNLNKRSLNCQQKQKCYNLLDNIENIIQQIPQTNKLLQKKIHQMQKEWQFQIQTNFDGCLKKIISQGLLPPTQQTLILMQQKRLQHIQKMDIQLMN